MRLLASPSSLAVFDCICRNRSGGPHQEGKRSTARQLESSFLRPSTWVMLVLPTQENLCAHSPMASMDDLKMSAHSEKARRRRRPGGPPLADVDGQDPDSWKSAVQGVLGEIRASSPTLQTFREHGLRLRESYDALRRAVQRARRQRVPQNSRGSGQQTLSTDLNRLLKDVGSKKESNLYAAGALVFGAGLFIAGAAPWLLPACFLLFSAICLPWRAYTFWKRKWGFFLLDFCYVSQDSCPSSWPASCCRLKVSTLALLTCDLWP